MTASSDRQDTVDRANALIGTASPDDLAAHFHAVDDSAVWSCRHSHPYATETEAATDAAALHADAPEYALTVVPCRKILDAAGLPT
jgi:hypothetical protein